MRQDALPGVVACYEDAFERNGFAGEYMARVDFTIASGTGKLEATSVRKVEPLLGADASDAASQASTALRACLGRAFETASVEPYSAWRAVRVNDYPIAFKAPQSGEHRRAQSQTGHVLIGPRGDRCRGLYSYRPPRDAALLYAQFAEAQAESKRHRHSDLDSAARATQRSYDVALELGARLRLEARRSDLDAAGRARMNKAEDDVAEQRRGLAKQLGCAGAASGR
jgi:hypothetical protein